MAAVHGQQWMGTPASIRAQVTDTLNFFVEIRNNTKKLQDTPDFVQNHPAKAKEYFIDCVEQLYVYTTTIRRNYAKDEQAQQHKQLTDHYEKKIAQLTAQLQEEITAKDNALSRVSDLASRLLKSGNPNITELSDPNRPMKLAEQFTSTYDDDWTDAFEFLTEQRKLSEGDSLNILYEMLKKCHEISNKASEIQYTQLENSITSPMFFDVQNHGIQPTAALQGNRAQMSKTLGATPASKDILKASTQKSNLEPLIKDFRKMIASETWKNVTPVAVMSSLQQSKQFPEDILQNADVAKYVNKCVQLCWLMGAQYPPMIIDFATHPGDKFNTNLFKEYRTRGMKVARTIWPPVYLHQGGPLTCKGYAEGDGKK